MAALRRGILAAACLVPLATGAEAQVTFEEVLASPDDPDLNIAYARQEIAAGRLQSAASVLERLLLKQPEWDAARLAYGIVLYRLRDNLGAIRELVKLEGRDLPGAQEADRLKYLRLAQGADAALRISGTTALGLRVDSNPSAAASGGSGVTSPIPRETDVAITSASTLRAEYDLGTDPAITAFATIAGELRHFFDTSSARIATRNATAGLTFQGAAPGGSLEVSVFGLGGVALQDYDLFARRAGLGTSFAYDLADGRSRTRILGGVSGVYESFDNTAFTGIADDRNGWLTTLDAGVQHFVTDAHRLSAGIAYGRKNAENDGFSYDRVTLSAGYLALLGGGVYSDTKLSYSDLDYDAPNGFQTFAFAREDRTWRARTALGSPLATIFETVDVELPTFVGDIVVQAGVTWTDRSSNVARYDFHNVSGDLLLIKRFQF